MVDGQRKGEEVREGEVMEGGGDVWRTRTTTHKGESRWEEKGVCVCVRGKRAGVGGRL